MSGPGARDSGIGSLRWVPCAVLAAIALTAACARAQAPSSAGKGPAPASRVPSPEKKSFVRADTAKLHRTLDSIADAHHGVVGYTVWNLDTGERLERRGDETFPTASLIKVPILVTVFDLVEKRQLSLDDPLTVLKIDQVPGSGTLQFMHPGITVTVRDAAWLMTTISDNTATNVLIDRLGIERVNADLAALGLERTALRRRMFDFVARARGLDNVTTPRDAARLLCRFVLSDGLSPKSAERARRILLAQQLNAGLPARLPFGTPWAHKTGNLPGLLHDAGWLEHDDGRRVVVTVFTDHLRNDGDGALVLARVGEAVAAWHGSG